MRRCRWWRSPQKAPVYEKVLSNAQEAKARDARLIGVVPMNDPDAEETFDALLPVPDVDELLSPILTVVPVQLLSYHIAARARPRCRSAP